MKKTVVTLVLMLAAFMGVSAQSIQELAKQKKADNKALADMMKSQKPDRAAKKQAKEYKKQGYQVVGSGRTIEVQIYSDQMLAATPMADETGAIVSRYIQHSGTAVAGTQSTAYAAARAACQSEIAALLETKIAGAMQQKIDNSQTSAINAATVDKFHERVKSIISATLTQEIPGLNIYRVLSNNNYEVKVTLSYDKKEVEARLKRALRAELELEGDNELNGIVDEVIQNME